MAKISIIRGDSRTITVNVTNSSGSAFDLTGCTVYFTVNATTSPTDDTSASIQKSTSSFSSPTSGVATITLTHTDTDSLTPGTYFYDVQLKDSSSNITSLKQDKFVITADITRRIT